MALEKYIVFPPGVDFSSLLGERGVGVGNQIMNEVEELATMVFEEDEDYLSDDHEKGGTVDDLVIDMPNGTEGSAKEVARGLVGADDITVPKSPKTQSPRSTKKSEGFNPPEGMDVDFEPPSTAAIVTNQMIWNVDIDFDEDHNAHFEPPNDEEGEEEPAKLKEKSAKISHRAASSKTGAIKARLNVGKQVQEIIELDSEDESPKMKGRETRARAMVMSDEDEEDDMDEDHLRSKTMTNSKLKSVSAAVKTRSGTRPGKSSTETKAKATSIPPPSDSDDAPQKKPRKGSSHISSKSKTGAQNVHETDKESEPTADEKPKVSLRRKLTVEVVMKSPFKGKGKEVRGSDDDKEPKKVKTTSVYVTPSGNKAAGARPEGLLKKAKGDARTRIKRKSISKEGYASVESEDEESPVQPKSTKRSKNGRKELASKEKDPQPKKSEPRMQPSASNNGNKTKTPVRSKPLRVYSSEDVESEDDESSTNVADAGIEELGSDEELPETIIPPETRTKTRATSKATTSRQRESDTRNNKERTSVANPFTEHGNKSTPTSKRTISVLSPSLAMSGGPDEKRKKVYDKAHKVVRQPKKSKFQVQIPISDSEGVDEDEVNAIISPRTRITKSNGFETSVQPLDVVNSSLNSKEQEKQRRRSSTSDPRKASKIDRVAVEPMRVDDDRKSRSTPASASISSVTVPRRNAAAKAAQRLHETLMPDLVNYEAQLKKAKGKNRQSTGSLSAFALETEQEERERDIGKRKKLVRSEEGDESDGEVQPTKKRRVSDEEKDTIKVKGKRTQKAKEEDSGRVEGSKP